MGRIGIDRGLGGPRTAQSMVSRSLFEFQFKAEYAYVDRTFSRLHLEAIVHHHVAGSRNYTIEIHKVLTLELLHRLFIDRN